MTTTNTFPAAILFDHDGTLVDTEPVWAAAKVALRCRIWRHLDRAGHPGLPGAYPCSSRLTGLRGARREPAGRADQRAPCGEGA